MRELIWPAVRSSFRKLDPRDVARNPVMFVVEVGSVITTSYFIAGLVHTRSDTGFVGAVTGWLWFTVLFANFAEAMAEGRGKAQADALRKMKTETLRQPRDRRGDQAGAGHAAAPRRRGRRIGRRDHPRRRRRDRGHRVGRRVGHHRRIGAGHPRERRRSQRGHGRHEGALRSDQGARSHRTRARRFLDRMIGLVEGAQRQKTPNEIALTILLVGADASSSSSSSSPCSRSPSTADAPQSATVLIALLVCLIPTTIGGLLVGDRHRRHGPARAPQRARHVRTSGRGGRRRRHAAARQDRHDHARQPAGGRVHPDARRDRRGARRRRPARLARRRDARGPFDRRAGQELRHPRAPHRPRQGDVRPVQRADAHERRRSRRTRHPQGSRRRHRAVDPPARR